MGRLCYPTTAPGRVLVPRVLGAKNCHVLDPDRAESERHGVQGGYGAVFAIQVQVLLSSTRVAVQF